MLCGHHSREWGFTLVWPQGAPQSWGEGLNSPVPLPPISLSPFPPPKTPLPLIDNCRFLVPQSAVASAYLLTFS